MKLSHDTLRDVTLLAEQTSKGETSMSLATGRQGSWDGVLGRFVSKRRDQLICSGQIRRETWSIIGRVRWCDDSQGIGAHKTCIRPPFAFRERPKRAADCTAWNDGGFYSGFTTALFHRTYTARCLWCGEYCDSFGVGAATPRAIVPRVVADTCFSYNSETWSCSSSSKV